MSKGKSETKPPGAGCDAKRLDWLLGADQSGKWVVIERSGLSGGLFATEQEAMRYARFESGGKPCRISRCASPLDFPACCLMRRTA